MKNSVQIACTVLLCGWLVALPAQADRENFAAVARVIDGYLQATGGRPSLAAVEGLSASGTYKRFQRTWPMQWHRRQPNLSRLRVEQSRGIYVRLNDGDTLWEQLPGDSRYLPLEARDAAVFELISTIVLPVVSRFESSQPITHLGVRTFEGQAVEILEYRNDSGVLQQLIFGERSLLPVAVRQSMPGETIFSQTVRLTDYRATGSIVLPHRIEVSREGWINEAITVTQYTINQGLFLNLFEVN